jgi:long-chain acyl-CoA synthetase
MTPGVEAPALVTPQRALGRRCFDELARSVEAGLIRSIRPATPLGIWIEDAVDFAAAISGALAARAGVFIIHPGATSARAEELCALEAGAAVLCDSAHADRLRGQSRRACGPGLVLVERAAGPVTTELAAGAAGGAVHFYTSGTDGEPKGVVRTRESLALEEATVGAHLGMAPGCTVLCAVPVTHGYGYTAGLFAPMSFGGTSVVARPRLAASLARLLIEHQPEIVVGVPAQYAVWSALRETYSGPLPRVWLCGGAPLPPAVRTRFAAAWGSVIAEQYGLIEGGAVTVDLEGTETLGRPYPGVSVTIEGAGSAEDIGEVVIRTPYGPKGYIGDPANDPAGPFTASGVHTGDNGWLDACGRLHLVGRRAHQLNVRGQQVHPAEVERAFWAVEGVHDVAVLGMDRNEGDQWVAAFVVCGDAITDAALQQATVSLDGYKRPQRVTRLPALPKTAAGKTDFDALRAIARTGAAQG